MFHQRDKLTNGADRAKGGCGDNQREFEIMHNVSVVYRTKGQGIFPALTLFHVFVVQIMNMLAIVYVPQ